MFYCNQECQKNDWKFHKFECKIYAANYETIGTFGCRFLLRLFNILEHFPDNRTKQFPIPNTEIPEFRSYNDLADLRDEEDFNEELELFLESSQLFQNAGLDEINYPFDKLYDHFLNMRKNILIQDYDGEDFAEAIFIVESGLSKSCNPNSCLVNKGFNMEVRALKNIQPFEEISVNSLPVDLSRENREKIINGRFLYKCSACDDYNEERKFFIIVFIILNIFFALIFIFS